MLKKLILLKLQAFKTFGNICTKAKGSNLIST